MSSENWFRCRSVVVCAVVPVFVVFMLVGQPGNLMAQGGDNSALLFAGRGAAVGGVAINTDGILKMPLVIAQHELQAARQQAMAPISTDLVEWVPLRKVSLRGLEEVLSFHRRNPGKPLSDVVRFLAGLQRIQYVFVFPEQNDIVLAGPAEGWTVDGLGNVVGRTTRLPVLLLDDLLVSLRSARGSLETGISCSIDPTAEGLQRLRSIERQLFSSGHRQRTIDMVEQAMGPQVVTVRGVPASSYFARIMVSADFHMKRLAMNFEPSPVGGMPSYLQLVKTGRSGIQNMLPRWWLAPQYEPLRTDVERLSWELCSQGVRCFTEDDFVSPDGSREHTGRSSAAAKLWADTMTAKYAELAAKVSIFAQLENVMELAVVAALIERENLLERAGASLPELMSEQEVVSYNSPRFLSTQVSLIKKGRNWILSASGGVQWFPWEIAGLWELADTLQPIRNAVVPMGDRWWWN